MNKIYIGKRASGKTILLIKKSTETGAAIVAVSCRKRRKQERNNEKLQLLLKAAQSDIDKLRAQSERELEEAKARTEQVRAQLGKEK